jgi:hypothetical protein
MSNCKTEFFKRGVFFTLRLKRSNKKSTFPAFFVRVYWFRGRNHEIRKKTNSKKKVFSYQKVLLHHEMYLGRNLSSQNTSEERSWLLQYISVLYARYSPPKLLKKHHNSLKKLISRQLICRGTTKVKKTI